MASSRHSSRSARFTLVFGALAALLAALAVLAWRAADDERVAQQQRVRADEVLGLVGELDAAAQPQAQRAMCAATGGPPLSSADVAPATWPEVGQRLIGLLAEDAAMLDTWTSLRRELTLFEQSFVEPLRRACAQEQRLGAAEVQSRVRVAQPQRARIDDAIKRLRQLALDRRRAATGAASEAASHGTRWLALLSLASVLMGVAAAVTVRSLAVQLDDTSRKVYDEVQEREMVREQLATTHRRMRVLIDHVNDAVVAFDSAGRIQWINPAGEALFGTARSVLHGCPVSLLMPGLDEALRSTALNAATVTDEHGLPWTTRALVLEGRRAGVAGEAPVPVMLDVSLVQTRVDGNDVGVCIARTRTDTAQAARATVPTTAAPAAVAPPGERGDAVASGTAAEDEFVAAAPVMVTGSTEPPSAATLAAVRDAFAAAPVQGEPVPVESATAPIISARGVIDLREAARAAVAAGTQAAAERRTRIDLRTDEHPLWVDVDRPIVVDVVQMLVAKAVLASPPGSLIRLAVKAIGEGARVYVADQGPGLPTPVARRLLEPGAVSTLPAEVFRIYGLALAQARELVRSTGGELGFDPNASSSGDVFWVEWPRWGAADEPVPLEAASSRARLR